MLSLMLFPNQAKSESASYSEAFWRGMHDAVHRARYNDGVNPENSLELCVPDVSRNEHASGYRHGYLAGRALVRGSRN